LHITQNEFDIATVLRKLIYCWYFCPLSSNAIGLRRAFGQMRKLTKRAYTISCKPRSGRGRSAECYLRFGIVDGCCSTTSRVSDGDLLACHSTEEGVPSALSVTTPLSSFTHLDDSSAMLN